MGNLLKTALILSAIAGLAAGVLLLIPFLTPLVFLALFTIYGALLIVYLKRNNMVGILTMQDGALLGAISGFASIPSALIVYMPISFIFSLFQGQSSVFGFKSSFTTFGYSVFILIMLVFFVALLSAVFNAFSGMMAAFIYEKIEDKPFDFQSHIDLEEGN
jgi:hypothetical protein